MRELIALLSGALFGTGLFLSGMTDTTKVQGFLDFFGNWDATLAFVMGGAILPMAVAWRVAATRSPLTGGSFPEPPSRVIDRNLILGAVMFGTGWGLVGLCPGPALASLSFGGLEGMFFLCAMGVGMWIAPAAKRYLDSRPSTA